MPQMTRSLSTLTAVLIGCIVGVLSTLIHTANAADQPVSEQKSLAELVAGEPILIEADQLSWQQRQNRGEYSGNVRLTQGKLSLWADHILVETDDDDQITHIHATSHQANEVIFQSLYVEKIMNATATSMVLKPRLDQLNLDGQPAQLSQPEQSLEASSIFIDLMTEELQAKGKDGKAAVFKSYETQP